MFPSQINITSVKIFSTPTFGIEVGYIFSSLRIRESIVHQFISGDITIEDDSNLYESLIKCLTIKIYLILVKILI